MRELKRRSIVKTLTWRIFSIFFTMGVVYAYNQDLQESVVVSLLDNGLKMFVYYVHERSWSKIDYGREAPEYQI